MANTHIFVAKSVLGTTAVWRQRTLAAHHTDKRNAHASELLELLSAEPATSVSADIGAKLNGYSDEEFGRVAMLVSRPVGFRIFPGSLSAFVQEVMNRIDESRAEIDTAFPTGEPARRPDRVGLDRSRGGAPLQRQWSAWDRHPVRHRAVAAQAHLWLIRRRRV